ncbi:asparagine synthetase [glutamine-hydrolyzing]-like [Ciona intestinalis]
MVCDVMEDGKLIPSSPVQFHQIGEMPVHFRYQNIDLEQHGGSDDFSIYRNIRTLFTNAVEKRLMGFQSVCTMLSGGLDSSLVSAIAAKKLEETGKGRLQTFIIDISESPDLKAARKVAEHIGSEHHEIVCTEEEILAAVEASIFALESYDTITLRDALQTLVLCKYAQGKTKNSLILCGDGADEVLQGYSFFQHHSSPEKRDVESRRLLRDLYLYDVLRIDHCTAVHGFETRVPYLDQIFTSYCLSLPPTMRAHKDIEKHVMRKSFEGTGLIPDEILWRRKEKLDDCVTTTDPWSRILLHVADKLITDKTLTDASIAYPHNTPKTKLELYYRQIFEKHFGSKMSELCPYQWKQKWVDANDANERKE